MIILGIDPGTTAIGYALIKGDGSPSLVDCGLLKINSKTQVKRLQELKAELSALLDKWHPVKIAVERVFFSKNAKTALAVSEARGVILLTTSLASPFVYEYTPLEVKKIVTGDGKADKIQLRKMVQMQFKETKILKARDDVFDAIAIALACFYSTRLEK